MNNYISGSFLRYSARGLRIQKCYLHVNIVTRRNVQKPAFISAFSPPRITKYSLASNSFTTESAIKQINDSYGNNKLESFYGNTKLRRGIFQKSDLFKNSLQLPTLLNVRYESTNSVLESTVALPEITNEVDLTGIDAHLKGLEHVFKNISESILMDVWREYLTNIHHHTGLPWWGTIIVSTVLLRTVILFPFSLIQRKSVIGLENAQRVVDANLMIVRKEITFSMKKFGWPMEFARTKFKEMTRELWKRALMSEKTHPLKPCTIIALQSTIWLSLTVAIANFCCAFPFNNSDTEALYSELTTGGDKWFTNLTIPDSTFILPLTIGLLNLSIIGIHYKSQREPTITQKVTLGTLAVFSVGLAHFSTLLPSAVVLYWIASSTSGLALNLLFLSPAKKLLSIPKLMSDTELMQDAKSKLAEVQDQLQEDGKLKKKRRDTKEV